MRQGVGSRVSGRCRYVAIKLERSTDGSRKQVNIGGDSRTQQRAAEDELQ